MKPDDLETVQRGIDAAALPKPTGAELVTGGLARRGQAITDALRELPGVLAPHATTAKRGA